MAEHTVIYIHAEAPAKPQPGAACNGCGVCCTVELCPLAQLRYWRKIGPCPSLRWLAKEKRYGCGMLLEARFSWIRRWIYRSIAAGQGCDSQIDPSERF